ncbi:MAG TPA: FAD-binding oxidoreductase [Cyclobacteriaceae bacterium]|nr:FAD-binding oxidoreductase [Cyclobacteriaceae bacterium]
MEHIVKINSIRQVTHDVRSYRFTKPEGYTFIPGQATEVSLNEPGWTEQKRPFTFTSLNEWPELEFTIKQYDDHDGVTHHVGKLQIGDEIIIRDVWGAIAYKGEGYFIAGGAGITPFIAIFRQLHRDKKTGGNHLYFSNKTVSDIILHDELDAMLGKNVHYVITGEENPRYGKGYIDREFLKREIKDFKKPFYICGPDKMVSGISEALIQLGASPEAVVFEK